MAAKQKKQASKYRKEKSDFEKDRSEFQTKDRNVKAAPEPEKKKSGHRQSQQSRSEFKQTEPEFEEKQNRDTTQGEEFHNSQEADNGFADFGESGGKEQGGEYRKRDTYHQSHKKSGYQKSRVHREH